MASSPVYQSTQSGTSANATLVINIPASTVQGDLLIAHAGGRSVSGTWTPPSGWTAVTASLNLGGSQSPTTGVFWKVATGAEPSNYTFTFSNAVATEGRIIRVTGADTTSPVDSSVTSVNGSSSTTITIGTVTPTLSNNLIILLTAQVNDGVSARSCTNVSSFTGIYDDALPSTGGVISMGWGTSTASGAAVASATQAGVEQSNGVALSIAAFNVVAPALFAGAAFSLFSIANFLKSLLPAAIALAFSILPPTVSGTVQKWTNQAKHSASWTDTPKS